MLLCEIYFTMKQQDVTNPLQSVRHSPLNQILGKALLTVEHSSFNKLNLDYSARMSRSFQTFFNLIECGRCTQDGLYLIKHSKLPAVLLFIHLFWGPE